MQSVKIGDLLDVNREAVREEVSELAPFVFPDEIVDRFWSHVNQHGPIPAHMPHLGPCWPWQANRTGRGNMHGQYTYRLPGDIKQTHVYAHRFAWQLRYGAIPKGQQVCHHCDLGICCRPSHFFLGTQADNLKDAARKKRFHTTRTKKGIDLALRLSIYAMPYEHGLHSRLAHELGVTKACITHIRRGRFVGAPSVRQSEVA